MIVFEVEDQYGVRQNVEIPEDISLSLMEVLKASEYEVAATCGGMALCATCHVEVLKGDEDIRTAREIELDMLDTLPNVSHNSRLACQIRINGSLNGAVFKLKENTTEV